MTRTTFAFQQPFARVWRALDDFGGMAAWSPDLAMSAQLQGRGVEPGAVRELTFTKPRAGIRSIQERVTACGEGWFCYELPDGFGPYRTAGSEWRLRALNEGCWLEVHSRMGNGPWWAMALRPLSYWQLRRGLKRALRGLVAHLDG